MTHIVGEVHYPNEVTLQIFGESVGERILKIGLFLSELCDNFLIGRQQHFIVVYAKICGVFEFSDFTMVQYCSNGKYV